MTNNINTKKYITFLLAIWMSFFFVIIIIYIYTNEINHVLFFSVAVHLYKWDLCILPFAAVSTDCWRLTQTPTVENMLWPDHDNSSGSYETRPWSRYSAFPIVDVCLSAMSPVFNVLFAPDSCRRISVQAEVSPSTHRAAEARRLRAFARGCSCRLCSAGSTSATPKQPWLWSESLQVLGGPSPSSTNVLLLRMFGSSVLPFQRPE